MRKKSSTRVNSVIKETMKTLYSERDETGDVTFIVESESIRAHRCVLAAISPKYKTQFYSAQPDIGEIYVDHISADAFKEFLQFFYLKKVVLTTKNIEIVLNLAKESLVDAFVTICIKFLMKVVKLDNFFWTYQLAIAHDIEKLKKQCEEKIRTKARKIFKSNGFVDCDRNLLIQILKLNSLQCKETEIFDACIAWAKAACQRDGIDSENMENLHDMLSDVMAQIRFCSMTVEEFAAIHSKYNGFFTVDETKEIFYMIGKVPNFTSERFNQMARNESKMRINIFSTRTGQTAVKITIPNEYELPKGGFENGLMNSTGRSLL